MVYVGRGQIKETGRNSISSYETTHSEVLLNDNICNNQLYPNRENKKLTIDSTHDEPYLGGVRCAGEMGVDLFRFGLIE